MIPDFNEDGNLPPGIHQATLAEIEEKFAYNIKRRSLFDHLLKLISDLKIIGCKIIYLDGSFATKKILPGDMDICWDENNIDFDKAFYYMPILFDLDFPRNEQQKIYCADIFPATLVEGNSKKFFLDFFQEDKSTNLPKGIIKLQI